MEQTTNKTQRMSIYFPLDLYQQVRKSAKEHRRSFNQEVLFAIGYFLAAQRKEENNNHVPTPTH